MLLLLDVEKYNLTRSSSNRQFLTIDDDNKQAATFYTAFQMVWRRKCIQLGIKHQA